jgi:hypothetical protein
MKALFISVLFSFFIQTSFSQIEFDDSFTFEIGLPNAFTNKANKTIMQGLVCVAPQYQFATKFGLAFGVGLHYTYFNINEFRFIRAYSYFKKNIKSSKRVLINRFLNGIVTVFDSKNRVISSSFHRCACALLVDILQQDAPPYFTDSFLHYPFNSSLLLRERVEK